jgi:hypothetical protein
MSGNTVAIRNSSDILSVQQPVLRYAFGSAIIMMTAMALDYTLGYLTPVLALGFLAPGAKPPTLKSSLFFLLLIFVTSLTGVLFSRFFIDYPLVFLPLLILIIFHLYYDNKLNQMKIWFLISLMLIPMISQQSVQMGNMVAVNLVLNAFLAIVLVTVVYFLFPARNNIAAEKKAQVAETLNPKQRFTEALKKTLVLMPLLVLFFVFSITNAILILIFASILSMNPATSNKKAGIALILANLGGGLLAIIAFNLLTVVPDFIFLGLITLFTGLLIGQKLFSKKPLSSLFGTAFSTFLLILGNVTSFVGEAGEMVWTRIFQLAIVVIYVVVAFYLVNDFIPTRKTEN